MVERQARERLPDLRVAQDDGEFVFAETRGDEFLQQRRCCGRQFRRLEQHAVAGGQRAERGRQRQLHRVIPRADDPCDTKRLPLDACASRLQVQWSRHALAAHPARKVRLRVRDFRGDDVQLGETRLVFGPVAEIAVHRGGESRFVLRDQRLESREPVDARAQVRIPFARECRALQREEPVEVGIVHWVVGTVVADTGTGNGRTRAMFMGNGGSIRQRRILPGRRCQECGKLPA